MFLGFVLNFIPYYAWVRLAFFVYMMAPATEGSLTFYKNVVKPFLDAHKEEIEEMISKVQSGAGDVAGEAMKAAKEQAKDLSNPENMMKAAAMANEV